ncbi:hypothetical protein A8H39_41155 [Paraburkholderia fungorum]|nr:hypothetical protein A8H39_41155 [Paraburkholderia fungorum]
MEFDPGWYETLKPKLPGNATLIHENDGHRYADAPKTFGPRHFDVVVVDGAERYRSARTAIDVVALGGMIILDNAEWYPHTADMIADAGFIEIRFSGFSPINAFTATSSIFLSRSFAFPRSGAARLPPRGGRLSLMERLTTAPDATGGTRQRRSGPRGFEPSFDHFLS